MVATQRTPEPSLRRAAILLSNLDADNRRRLLAHLPPQDAAKLRAAAAALSDVDPLEIRRTVSAFVGRISATQQQPQSADSAPAASENRYPDGSHAGRPNPASPRSEPAVTHSASSAASANEGDANASGGLKFLNDVSDATLLRAIGAEHPQTIAVVLASIDPRQAARLLQQLGPQPRGEAIRRLSRLEEVPQDVIDDIGRHLRGLIGTVDQVGSGEGRRLLTSIFSALGADDRQALGAGLVDTDGGIAAALAEAEKAQPRTTPASPSRQDAREPATRDGHSDQDTFEPADSDQNNAERNSSERNSSERNNSERNNSEQGRAPRHGERYETSPHILQLDAQRSRESSEQAGMPNLPTVAEADTVLESLPAARLREVLAELTAREALLTLCGLTPRCVRRLLRTMPRRAAKEVRQRLNSLGPLELSEIDRAKQRAATAAVGSPAPAARAA